MVLQVWNVETQELIATYTAHSGPVMCCMWSPLDPDYVITGSADSTVRIWKVSNNPPQEKVHTKVQKKSKRQQSKANKIADIAPPNDVSVVTCTMSQCSISDAPQTVQSITITLQNIIQKTSMLRYVITYFRIRNNNKKRSKEEKKWTNIIFLEKH